MYVGIKHIILLYSRNQSEIELNKYDKYIEKFRST
jgi:hypothetical protein